MKKDPISATRVRHNEAKQKDEKTHNHELCSSFVNLPLHLTTHIFLQLPIKSLLSCKCVCKDWKTMISEPHFTKLHFEQSRNTLMIRTNDYDRVSRTLYLLECEPEKFDIGSDNRVKLEPICTLPLRDDKLFREEKGYSIKNIFKCVISVARLFWEKRETLYSSCNRKHGKFDIVNSCNGLLCLCEPSTENPIVVCNPVTGEFIRLPGASMSPSRLNTARVRAHVYASLGFHPKDNEYKVIRIWTKHVRRANFWVSERLTVDIHTLGTSLWRNIEVDPQISILRLSDPTYINGVVHWIEFKGIILCFCFETEKLKTFPSPPGMVKNHANGIYNYLRRMGELKGILYICDSTNFSNITMWVMNEYGIGESWSKVYNIPNYSDPLDVNPRHYGYCFPIKQFEESAALLYNCLDCFLYYEPEKYGFKMFQIHGSGSQYFEVIPHIPSLISLKDAVKGDNIKVLNFHSRCPKFKLQEENEVIFMSQKFV
ncbi:F-box/kelch-repeat protein At3g23880-like [Lathyrus oleraceus]|uniref:F-box/kelch-repeat protein At3g23880-like n=1 Tax=Pisum sativum TaxID=3888 RepID=UPI0021CFB25A|nr:F-box/kelch-repeat protein At3g23880-like [Pisum sativum]